MLLAYDPVVTKMYSLPRPCWPGISQWNIFSDYASRDNSPQLSSTVRFFDLLCSPPLLQHYVKFGIRVCTDSRLSSPLRLDPLELLWTLRHPGLSCVIPLELEQLKNMVEDLTDYKLLRIKPLYLSVILCDDEHTLYPFARPLVAEHHLQNSRVNGFPGYLSPEHVQFPVRDLEVCRGIFMLQMLRWTGSSV